LIPYLKLNLDKVIYSDVDVIVLGDIKEMYDEDLEDFIIGAIWQELYDKTINMDNLKLKLNISTEHKFFFSGNLLINCKKWREQNITQKLIDLFNKNKNLILTCPDQDLLNMFFDNNYKILSSKYCYVNQNFDYFKEEYPNIIIRHYNGQIKPWNINENTKTSLFHNLKEFWYYAKITRFFKELDKKTQNKVEQQKYIRQMQYWKNVNKITKILDRSKI
jgi:lipopolysaccharide biosynthesis glycosyltransferase